MTVHNPLESASGRLTASISRFFAMVIPIQPICPWFPPPRDRTKPISSFFHHPLDGSRPGKLGTIRFPDLPSDSGETELHLDAIIGPTGLLTITVRHRESGRVERLEMEIPDEVSVSAPAPRASGRTGLRSVRIRWVLGVLFVAAGLALVFWLTMQVTDWGREEVLEAPVSSLSIEPPAVTA